MKRISILTAVVALLVGLLSMGAMAQSFVGAFDAATGDDALDASAWSNLGIDQGPSNVAVRSTEFTTEVQVAQWSRWVFTGTKWTWFVRKPGEYYADSITATIHSNGDVAISFDGFANPEYLDENVNDGVKQYIESAYGVGSDPTAADFSGWVDAADLNDENLIIPDSQALHFGQEFKLWNKINVTESNSASTYRNTGTVSLTLQNQKPWIDEDGEWDPGRTNLEEYVTTDRHHP